MIKRILNKLESIYKYRYFSLKEKGAYNFLVDKIYKSTDIDFIESAWKLDHFREVLVPQELDLENLKNILVLAPHQDDESIGCGGTLIKLAEKGCKITIAFLTDGAELSNPINSIPIRKKEAEQVASKLNASIENIGIDNVSMNITTKHFDDLVSLLNKEWSAVFSVWPIDQPPKHRVCSYFFGKSLKASNYSGTIINYAVHTDLLPNFYVDISKEIENKQKLLSLYSSQMDAQNYMHLSKGLDAWRSRYLKSSPKERYIETFLKIPTKGYQDFQNVYDKSNANQLFKGNEYCLKAFDKLKKMV